MTNLLQDHPQFNTEVMLWIYNIQAKQWISCLDPTFPQNSFRVNTDDQRFLKSLYWLNIGGMLFPVGIDPNENSPLFPIVFSKEFCIKYGISQDDLRLALQTGNLRSIDESARVRNEVLQAEQKEVQKKEKEQKAKQAEKDFQAKVKAAIPKTYSLPELSELLQDWQPKTLVKPATLELFKKFKRVEIEYNDQDQMRIKQ